MRILIASAALAFTVDTFAQGVVSSHYPSLKGARDDKVFSRGLLPDVLPPSTHDIEVNYNMKSRVSSGAHSAPATRLKARQPTAQRER